MTSSPRLLYPSRLRLWRLGRMTLLLAGAALLTTACGPDHPEKNDDGGYHGPDITAGALLSVDESDLTSRYVTNARIAVSLPIARLVPELVSGDLRIEIRGLDGRLLADASRAFELNGWRAEVEVPVDIGVLPPLDSWSKGPLADYVIVYRVEDQDGGIIRGRRSLFEAFSWQDVRVVGPNAYHVDYTAQLRVMVRDPLTREPVPDARITMTLNSGRELAAGRSGLDGSYVAGLTFANEEVGEQVVDIEVESPLGIDRVSVPIEVVRELRTMITTDKPLYKPGQTLHVRTMTLAHPDRKPVANAPVEITVSDAEGNRLFREHGTTDAFGIASTDLDIARQVNMGTWKIEVSVDGLVTEKEVPVEAYALPKFEVGLQADRGWYRPGTVAQLVVTSDYFFGQPVAGGSVVVSPTQIDGEQVTLMAASMQLDAFGVGTIDVPIPGTWTTHSLDSGAARVLLDIEVTDATGRTERTSGALLVANAGVRVHADPVSALLPGENTLLVTTTDPFGGPLAAEGSVYFDGAAIGFQTDGHGVARVDINVPEGQSSASIAIDAVSPAGDRASTTLTLQRPGLADEVIAVRPDASLYAFGGVAMLDIRTLAHTDVAYVDIVREGQVVSTKEVALLDGQAVAPVSLTHASVPGLVTFRVWAPLPDGRKAEGASLVWVDDPRALHVAFSTAQETYRPGEEATLDIAITDALGHPVAAALGLTIVDEAVYALQEVQPGAERMVFQLAGGLNGVEARGQWSPADLVGEASPEDRAIAAEILFAGASVAGYPVSISTWQDAYAHALEAARRGVQLDHTRIVEWFSLARKSGLYEPSVWDQRSEAEQFIGSMPRIFDPWGQPYTLGLDETAAAPRELIATSDGPDELPDTADDVEIRIGTFQLR